MDDAKIIIVVMLITIGVVLGIVGLAHLGNRHACNILAEETGIATRYEFWNGCFVNIDDQWTPKSRWINNSGN